MVNRFFEQQNYGGSLEYYIFELANYSFLVLLISIFYKLKYININSFIVWSGIFFSPLLFNYFLISPFLFPDQFTYSSELMSLKTHGVSIDFIEVQARTRSIFNNLITISLNPITFSVKLLGLAPIPNYMTVTSLAFASKFFLFLSFLMLKNFFKNENILLLFFLIPSFLLYTSLSLRETIIILIGIFFLLNMLRNNYLISLVLILPLIIVKPQVFAFFAVYFIGRLIFRAHKNFYGLIIFLSSILLFVFIFTTINTYYSFNSSENSYINFLVPGMIMLVIIQTSFNHLSEVIISMKQIGSFNDYLVSPISRIEIFFSFLFSSIFVCLVVAFLNLFVLSFFTNFENINYIFFAYYVILCAVIFSSIGALTGFLSFTWDVQSTVSNFFIMPVSFFSGTFFSINAIDKNLKFIFQYNPFYYLVKGFRNSFFNNVQINFYHVLFKLFDSQPQSPVPGAIFHAESKFEVKHSQILKPELKA